jgi:hypothetical protein
MITLTLTPEDNVKYQEVVDGDKIIRRQVHDHATVHVEEKGKKIKIDIANISLYEHKLFIKGKKYHILQIVSR